MFFSFSFFYPHRPLLAHFLSAPPRVAVACRRRRRFPRDGSRAALLARGGCERRRKSVTSETERDERTLRRILLRSDRINVKLVLVLVVNRR